ncbi:MAG: hypothetical protein PHF37_07135 [Phycisphaerae bacterium]|nr:hypothetical protein [Phycisphaerae bacterium]
MLNNFIKNERFLRFCGNLAEALAWFLLLICIITIIGFLFTLPKAYLHDQYVKGLYNLVLPKLIFKMFTIFLLLGINQFIKCLTLPDFKPNWILRLADKIIYIYAALLFINFVYNIIHPNPSIYSPSEWTLIFSGIFTSIKILLWIGAGMALKRIIPIVQESKSLV